MKKMILSTVLAAFVMGALRPNPLPPIPRPGKGKPPVPCDDGHRTDCKPAPQPGPTRRG